MSRKSGFVGYPTTLSPTPIRPEPKSVLSRDFGAVNDSPDEDTGEDQQEDTKLPTVRSRDKVTFLKTESHPPAGIGQQDPRSLGEEPIAFDVEDNVGTHTITSR